MSGFTIQGGLNGDGGSLRILSNAAPKIINNVIQNNSVFFGDGGGIGVQFANPLIQGNIIRNNGSAAYCSAARMTNSDLAKADVIAT